MPCQNALSDSSLVVVVIIAVSVAYAMGSSLKNPPTILGGSHKLLNGIFVSLVGARQMRWTALGLVLRGRSWVRV